MTALDIFVFLLLIGGAAIGFVRGFVHEVISLFAWVVAIAMLKLFRTATVEWADRNRDQRPGRRGGARLRLLVHPELPDREAGRATDRREDAAPRLCSDRSTGFSA